MHFSRLDGSNVTLETLLKVPGDILGYDYRLDAHGWRHELLLEEIVESEELIPRCLDAKGAAPPEDCGGGSGYADILALLSHKKEAFDPDLASVAELNLEIQEMFREVGEDEEEEQPEDAT